MKQFGHQRPRRDESGAIVELKESPAGAVTRETLGHTFGPDFDKRLVVTLEREDMIVLRPSRTTRAVRIKAMDVYFYCLRCQANCVALEQARIKKAKKAERLARLRQQRAERKLFRK